jgi:membrane protease YdiL (CAAX protease family)
MSLKRRALPTLALLLIFFGLWLLLSLKTGTVLTRWHSGLYWNYSSHIIYFAIAFGALFLLRRNRAEYGLQTRTLRPELRAGLPVAVVMIAAPLLAEAGFGDLRLRHSGMTFVVSTIVYQTIFVGFGEELLFRGFFQGEFNRIFPRRFRLWGIHFGWSLIIVSLLFGLAHLMDPFDPFHDRYGIKVGAGISATLFSLVVGLVRERFGGIVGASVIHAGFDLFVSLYGASPVATIAMGVAIFASCFYLFSVMSSKGPGDEEPPRSGERDSPVSHPA